MKRKSLAAILLALVLCFTMALTACDDDNDDQPSGGGIPKTPEQKIEMVQDMPNSTDGGVIEGAIGEVFGADIDLPEGTYSAQSFTSEGVSAYMVTVSGANTTATDYYNSIKAEMLAEGYAADDGSLSFYKIDGPVVYSASVEGYDGEVIVVFGAASLTSKPGGTIPGGTIPGGTIPGGTTPDTLPEGNLTAFPAATINEMFSELGVTIPNCTSGSSYSIDMSYEDLETGVVSISVTCYGMTEAERDAYKQALKDAGFRSQYYLVYSHNNRFYSDLVATSTFHDQRQTFTITFSTTYEEPAYDLPENIKITFTANDFYYYTAIKIGNDYYMKEEMSYDGEQMNLEEELYYKYTDEGWELWENYGDGWEKSNYDNETELKYVEELIFDFIAQEAEIDEDAVQGEGSTLLERAVEVWEYATDYGVSYKYYKDVEMGIILKYEYTMFGYTQVYTVTSIDTTVTSFGDVELPQ